MRGRKPKPTPLKVLDGTRKDRINPNEPKVEAAPINPPHWLGLNVPEAMDFWDELAPVMQSAGLLTKADVPLFAQLCECLAILKEDPLNFKAREMVRKIGVEFGMSPSARSRIKLPEVKEKDEFAAFMASRNNRKKSS